MEISSPKAQTLFTKFKDNHSPEFVLKGIYEVYFPFYECKAQVAADTTLQLDLLSKIILEYLEIGSSTHVDLCAFLGIPFDSFLNSHLHFLIREQYIEETYNPHRYTLTLAGKDFLKGLAQPTMIEIVPFDFHYNSMIQKFFNPKRPIDEDLSEGKKGSFVGYRPLNTKEIQPNGHKDLPFKHKPRIETVERPEFATWFNTWHPNHRFYDLESEAPKTYKRSISFLVLEFEDENQTKQYEVRRHEKTLVKGTSNELEIALTSAFSKFMTENPKFLVFS
jgi:hypothetical protein